MRSKLIVKPTERVDSLRSWIAYRLVDLANWVRPSNPAAMSFLMGLIQEQMFEEMKYGRSELEIKVRKQKYSV